MTFPKCDMRQANSQCGKILHCFFIQKLQKPNITIVLFIYISYHVGSNAEIIHFHYGVGNK